MGGLLFGATTAALMVLMAKSGRAAVGEGPLRGRPFPWAAAVLTVLAVAGVALQLSWPGAMEALDADPAENGWWREFTSVFMQNGGVGGVLWNLATLALVAALAHWCWGGTLTLLFFLSGILLPERLDTLLGIGGDAGTDPRNFAGSSGATYFLGATLAAALLTRVHGATAGAGAGKERVTAVAVPVLGLAMWLTQENGHGLVAVYGFVVGAGAAGVWAVRGRMRRSPGAVDCTTP